MDFVFAPASEADFDRLFELRMRVLRESLERVGRFNPARAHAFFRQNYAPQQTRLIIVEGDWAGCVALKPAGDEFWLQHFYLHESFQGGGLGSAVLRSLLVEADAAERPVRLSALKGSPADRFYRRHGFVETGEDETDVYYHRPVGG